MKYKWFILKNIKDPYLLAEALKRDLKMWGVEPSCVDPRKNRVIIMFKEKIKGRTLREYGFLSHYIAFIINNTTKRITKVDLPSIEYSWRRGISKNRIISDLRTEKRFEMLGKLK